MIRCVDVQFVNAVTYWDLSIALAVHVHVVQTDSFPSCVISHMHLTSGFRNNSNLKNVQPRCVRGSLIEYYFSYTFIILLPLNRNFDFDSNKDEFIKITHHVHWLQTAFFYVRRALINNRSWMILNRLSRQDLGFMICGFKSISVIDKIENKLAKHLWLSNDRIAPRKLILFFSLWINIMMMLRQGNLSISHADLSQFFSSKGAAIDAVLWPNNSVIMSAKASQITSLTIVYSTVYLHADQRKHQNSASLAVVRGFSSDRWIPYT